MTVGRLQFDWSGYSGAPGLTQLYFTGPDSLGGGVLSQAIVDGFATSAHAFMDSLANHMPSTVSITMRTEVEEIDVATGVLQSIYDTPAKTVIQGNGVGSYSGASGACITWATDGIKAGRRIQGRTFVVPLEGSSYEGDGTLSATTIADYNSAVGLFLDAVEAANPFVIYSRPGLTGPGQTARAVSGRIRDKAAVLRGRRD